MTTDIRICFVGDSLVNGTGDDEALGWPGRICAEARKRGYLITYYNLGVRRETTADILNRWKEECARRLPSFCDARVVFSCGVNDTTIENGAWRVPLEASVANVQAIISEAKGYSTLIVGPPPVADDEQNRRIELLSGRYRQCAAELGVSYIDLISELVKDGDYIKSVRAGDGAHPASAGYERISEIVSRSPLWWFREP